MMRLRCRFGLHRWTVTADPKTRYSKAGILAGSVETGVRACACGKQEEVYRFSSLLRFCTDDTGWIPYPKDDPEVRQTVYEHFLPMAELDAWKKTRDQTRHAKKIGAECVRCRARADEDPAWSTNHDIGHYVEERGDHGHRWWVGYRCSQRWCRSQGHSYYEPKGRIELTLKAKKIRRTHYVVGPLSDWTPEKYLKLEADRLKSLVPGLRFLDDVGATTRVSIYDTDRERFFKIYGRLFEEAKVDA